MICEKCDVPMTDYGLWPVNDMSKTAHRYCCPKCRRLACTLYDTPYTLLAWGDPRRRKA